MRHLLSASLLSSLLLAGSPARGEIPPIPRVLPPVGLEIPAELRERLESRLAATKTRISQLEERSDGDIPDAEIFSKAVELALLHREFYAPKDFEKADWALDEANVRLDEIARGEASWRTKKGLVVRGYRSDIDGSSQPYGVVVPDDYEFSAENRAYVWLHGRGDKNTDLHFLYERSKKAGQIAPPGALVLHPFGRHCVGWKHAGEIDVLEMLADAVTQYGIDPSRVVLIGFSMGGAGAWHLGAHYADRWVAVSPGAGFAETARYQRLTPDRYPPWFEQKLWGLYDVPGYTRNLFNVPIIAYSGENDKQIQAARVMEEAFAAEGRTLTHLIGPGVEHKYEPDTLQELIRRLEAAAVPSAHSSKWQRTRRIADTWPKRVHVQTKTLQYNQMEWVSIQGLEEHWKDARLDAEFVEGTRIAITTNGVTAFALGPWHGDEAVTIEVDGQKLSYSGGEAKSKSLSLIRDGSKWSLGRPGAKLLKRPGLQGPIDHAFMSRFLVILPTGKSSNPAFQTWCDAELDHFQKRWRALMRAELPVKRDVDTKWEDWRFGTNLILWGDAESNSLIRDLKEELPIRFNGNTWALGEQSFDGNRYAPVAIFPNVRQSDEAGIVFHYLGMPKPRNRGYIVLNSGLTFREGHDRTNSQQNPKLPDWAIIDITTPPDAFAPGRIHDAGFFDEQWKLKGQPKGP
jgi:dienelactone hydrolase